MIRSGYSSLAGQLAAFSFSAILHEVLISIPLRMFSIYAAAGMIGQIPLIILTRWLARGLQKPQYGNVVFWISFLIMGQPLIILLYAYDYAQASQSHTSQLAIHTAPASVMAQAAAETIQSKAAAFFAH
jgi:hypothetical protein